MRAAKPLSPGRLSRQILGKVLVFGVIIVSVATIGSYLLVYEQSKDKTLSYLRQYMSERRQQENAIFSRAYDDLSLFRDEFMKLYLSDVSFTDEDFRALYATDKDGAVRMKEELFKEHFDKNSGRSWGLSSFIGNNQPVDSPDFKRRLLLAAMLVNRYGPAWLDVGVLHATFPENALVIFSPDDPWGLKAEPDLPMNELGTIKATLQSENPERKPVWTGLYYDDTAGKWTLTLEVPVDYQGRHLVNPSMDVALASIMGRLDADHLEGASNFIVSKNGFLIAHPGKLSEELKEKGQLSLEKLNDPGLTRMYREIRQSAGASDQGVFTIDDKEGENYLLAASLEGPDWWFVMVYPKTLLAQEAHNASQLVLLLGFSLFVLYSFALYYVISKKVRAPLRRLQYAASLIAEGKYDEVVKSPEALPLEENNEISQLAGAFLDMTRQVSEMNANLQGIVENRTRELETANAKLRDLSLLDGLTGIHNRRSFDRDIATVFDQARRGVASFVLMMADADFFKNYNDLYGHTAGDEALRFIASLIADAIRAEDRAYRYGGEEIAVIFNNADKDSAAQIGGRILEATQRAGIAHKDSPHGCLTLSAGLVEYDPRFQTVTDVINAADASLYEAKAGGRNRLRVCVSSPA